MTGFGVGDAPLGPGRLIVEVRSLNHRFVEARVRVPTEISEYGFFVEQACRERFKRGRYDVSVRLEGNPLPPPSLDHAAARAVYQGLCALRDDVSPGTEVPVSAVTNIPDLFRIGVDADPEPVRAALLQALDSALQKLNTMRATEGKALEQELFARLSAARSSAAEIASRSPQLAENYRRRLNERLERIVKDSRADLDQGRLETEVALLAERTDVAEELARLDSHFDHFEQLCQEQQPVGRRLDFLLQEISREANTIGSKSQDVGLSHAVVQLKAEVERLREQVQNVE